MRKQDKIFLLIAAVTELLLIVETQLLDELALECLIIWTVISLVGLTRIIWDMLPVRIVKRTTAKLAVQEVKVHEEPEDDRIHRVTSVSRFAYDCPL